MKLQCFVTLVHVAGATHYYLGLVEEVDATELHKQQQLLLQATEHVSEAGSGLKAGAVFSYPPSPCHHLCHAALAENQLRDWYVPP